VDLIIVIVGLIKFNGIFKDLPGLIDKISDNALGISTTLVGLSYTEKALQVFKTVKQNC
jgi:hypothetical protein